MTNSLNHIIKDYKVQLYNDQLQLRQKQSNSELYLQGAFLRATGECFARLSHRLSVCLSVRLSVTLVSCIKTVRVRITKSSLLAATRTIVLCDKISRPWVRGFPSNEGVKKGYPFWKDVILPLLACLLWKWLKIGTDMLLVITSTGDGIFRFINIDNLERLWISKRGVSDKFFAIFDCSAHFNSKLRRNG